MSRMNRTFSLWHFNVLVTNILLFVILIAMAQLVSNRHLNTGIHRFKLFIIHLDLNLQRFEGHEIVEYISIEPWYRDSHSLGGSQ